MMAPKRKGAPAAAAAGSRKSLRGGGRLAPGADLPDDAADRRLAADTKKAEEESRRDSFVRVASTEGLWAWGKDHDGWTLARGASRDAVIDALMKEGALAVPSMTALNKNWRKVCGGAARASAPLDAEDEDDSSADGDDPPQEDVPAGTVAKARRLARLPRQAQQRRRHPAAPPQQHPSPSWARCAGAPTAGHTNTPLWSRSNASGAA